jgi:hypothetical protein
MWVKPCTIGLRFVTMRGKLQTIQYVLFLGLKWHTSGGLKEDEDFAVFTYSISEGRRMKFILVLTLFGLDGPNMEYVIHSGITGEYCVKQLELHQELLERSLLPADFNLSCEKDWD